jgi:hypothetical protein
VNRFIDNSQVVTTNNCNTVADFHTKNHSTLSLLSLLGNSSPQRLLLCSIFARRFLVTNLSNEDSSASVVRWLTLRSRTLTCQLQRHLLASHAELLSTACSVDCLQNNSLARTPRKTLSSLVKNACLLARYIAVDISEPHRKRLLRHRLYCCVRIFRALPRSGSTYHSILYLRRVL